MKTGRTLGKMLLSAAALLAVTPGFAKDAVPVYRQASVPVADRVSDLLSRMTLEEKVAQLESLSTIPAGPGAVPLMRGDAVDPSVARTALAAGLGTYVEIPGPSEPIARLVARRNSIQKWLLDNTRLGIPALFHGEALHGAVVSGATLFPQAIALGSTWDRKLVHDMFSVVARESRAAGNAMVLAPVFDLAREPRFGRVEESYSEDPYLAGEMGVAAVRGLQGDGPGIGPDNVIATAKHFVHGQPEAGTNVAPSDFSERTMRQVFMYPFQKAVQEGKIGAVMASYNENRGGIPAHADSWLLKDVLRGEWGFKGLTVSDYLGVFRLQAEHRVAADLPAAAVLAFNAGLDMELPNPSSYPALIDAVRSGKVSLSDLDAAVGRVLTAKFAAGLFEHPFVDGARAVAEVGPRRNTAIARRVADEAIILLKNDNGVLPLEQSKIHTLAVIGPNADKERFGSYASAPPYFVTVLEGIRKRVGNNINVTYAEGVRISEPDTSQLLNTVQPYTAPDVTHDQDLIEQAAKVAAEADVVVLVLGGNESVSREAFADLLGLGTPPNLGDTDTLELPGRQNELVHRIAKLGKPVVAIMLNGRPYSLESISDDVPAILEGWYLGQETGNALAGVLFGDVNPSGRLPVTIARNAGQLPVFYYHTPAARLGYVGSPNSPLYPFGFGLGYTSVTFAAPTIDKSRIAPGERAKVTISLTNSGARPGDEVVQMYVHHELSSIVQPVMWLRGFERVHLAPGQTRQVSFDVGPEQLAILDKSMKWTVEPGTVDILIGANSMALQPVKLEVSR